MLVAFYCLRHSPPQLLIMQYISRFRFSAAIAAKCVLPALKCKKGRLPPPRFQYFPVQPRPIAGDGVPLHINRSKRNAGDGVPYKLTVQVHGFTVPMMSRTEAMPLLSRNSFISSTMRTGA